VSDFVTGEMVDAIVSFEKAGEVAVTIRVKSRADMMKHH
jgi:copper(I)-binding protein